MLVWLHKYCYLVQLQLKALGFLYQSCFQGISEWALPSSFCYGLNLHILPSITVSTLNNGGKQGIDQQNFNRKSILRKIIKNAKLLHSSSAALLKISYLASQPI